MWFRRLPGVACFICFCLQAENGFYLLNGDRVLVCTDDRAVLEPDPAFVETFVTTRFPHAAIRFLWRGWDRIRPEVLVRDRPTVAVLGVPLRGSGSVAYTAAYELLKSVPILRISSIPPTALDLLISWNAPTAVSVVEIDAPAKRVVASENTRVRELESDRVVAWSQDDESLPLPGLAAFIPRAAKINVETLQVRGLGSGEYKLLIDGWLMGTFWRERFEEGIDLTLLPTPMMKQAAEVHRLVLEHQKLGSMVDATGEDAQKLESDLLERLFHVAEPVTHDYEIVPVNR
jgi:hypothetical protein